MGMQYTDKQCHIFLDQEFLDILYVKILFGSTETLEPLRKDKCHKLRIKGKNSKRWIADKRLNNASGHRLCLSIGCTYGNRAGADHGTYIKWQLRTCCARLKLNGSFPKNDQMP